MKKIMLTFSFLLLSTSVFAWTIGPMNYQGRLLDAAGIPVTGTYSFKISIYDAALGGTLKFSEQHSNVVVDDGVYSILVSTGSTLSGTWDINLWNTPTLYLEAEVNGQTLTPRHLLAATPFAYQANLALTTNNALALGGKSSGVVLQDICRAGKGKWLELVSQCLGVGASFPGPAIVALSTLTASTDLSNLDLSNADIRGIDFGSAYFTNTVFKGTRLNISGFAHAHMLRAVLDSVNADASSGTVLYTDFTDAKVTNMSLGSWNLSGAKISGSSTSSWTNLITCPTFMPSIGSYTCRQMSGSTNYFIVGVNMDYSSKSPSADSFFLSSSDSTMFDHSALAFSSFEGDKIRNLNFYYTNLLNTNFNKTEITDSNFYYTLLAFFDGFNGAYVENVNFYPSANANIIFNGTRMTRAFFYESGGNVRLGFQNSVLNDVQINLPGASDTLEITTNTTASGLDIVAVSSVTFDYANIIGGLNIGNAVGSVSLFGARFVNGNISGNWRNSVMSDSDGASFTNVSFFGADFTGATGWLQAYEDQTVLLTNVNWYGATCPDGYHVGVLGGTCIGHFL